MPAAYEERILYHACEASISYGLPYIISRQRYIIEIHNKCDIIMAKESAFMSENKLLDLSFEFAVAIVNLVDDILCKALSAKKRKLKIKYI